MLVKYYNIKITTELNIINKLNNKKEVLKSNKNTVKHKVINIHNTNYYPC